MKLKEKSKNKLILCLDKKKWLWNIIKKIPSASASLRGSIYEDKIISLIKEKAKSEKKSISIDEAEKIIINQNKQSNDTKVVEAKLKKENLKIKKYPTKKHSKTKKS